PRTVAGRRTLGRAAPPSRTGWRGPGPRSPAPGEAPRGPFPTPGRRRSPRCPADSPPARISVLARGILLAAPRPAAVDFPRSRPRGRVRLPPAADGGQPPGAGGAAWRTPGRPTRRGPRFAGTSGGLGPLLP